jgi:hypothetical protein
MVLWGHGGQSRLEGETLMLTVVSGLKEIVRRTRDTDGVILGAQPQDARTIKSIAIWRIRGDERAAVEGLQYRCRALEEASAKEDYSFTGLRLKQTKLFIICCLAQTHY